MIRLFLFLLCLVFFNSYAQNFSAGEQLAMGGSGIAQSGIYSLSSNPSGITNLSRPIIALAYQQHYLQTDIQSQGLYAAIPLKRMGTFGLVVHNHGIVGTSTFLKAGLTYARKFGSTISTSISANYHQRTVDKYLGDNTMSLDLGIQYDLYENLQMGFIAKNVSRSKFDPQVNEYLATELGLGVKYIVSKYLTFISDVNYFDNQKLAYHGGLAYSFDHRFVLRGGAQTYPMNYFAGVGILFKKLHIDLASSFHSRLGSSPQLALAYEF